MAVMRRLWLMLALSALVATGCGGDADPGGESTPSMPADAADCGNVTVPGHEAVAIRLGGADCELAEAVAAAAEGRGRAPYEAEGFACEPADAGGGDTDYTCTRGEASIRFRYGTA